MGYDNECVVNILSLPGEYFCPVCRTLIDPNEALQSQCTHLYCKPCLAYVVATTHACPYDGYLVTEADSKPLVESSKELAETIGKTAVHCLYHRSGCQWQGTLAESTVHCAGCNYGNSAVVCNRCGTQIIHRQVQDHAQICPGIQPQAQTAENAQAQAAAAANQDSSSSASAASTAAASTTATAVATPAAATTAAPSAPASSEPASAPSAASAATGQTQAQGGAVVYPQAAAQAPTPEQWYQQQQMQYQQYYQQYPGYDPYQQQYQQYAQYQQQAYPQYMQPQMQAAPQHVIPGQQQPQPYMQQPLPLPQPQPGQPQAQAQPQPQPQPQTQPQGPGAQPQLQQQHIPQLQPQPQPQPHPFPQLQAQPQPQVPVQLPQMQTQQPLVPPQQPQNHPPPHGHAAGQPYPQPQPHAAQARPPQLQAPPQHQQPIPPQQLPQQMPHPQAYPQPSRPQHPPQNQPLPHPPPQPQLQQVPMQVQPQPQPHHHSQPIPQMQPPQPPAHAVPGYQSYPQPIPGPPQQRPMHMHPQQQGMPPQHPLQSQSQFPPQQPPQMRPPNSQMQMPVQQQPAMPPPQGPHANLHPSQQQVQHPVHQPGQQVFPQSSMQPHGNHGFPQPQAQGTLHPSHPLQQGPVPPQHQLHPQQSLRSQGPAYMQQPTPGQPHPQLNAPPAQGLPQHQAQARPMMVSQGMSQQPVPQSPGAGLKLMQPGANQQSPNQNYMGRANPAASMSSLLQSGSLQQSQLPHSGSQGGLVPASPATPKQGTSSMDDGKTMKNAEGIETGEKISEDMFDSKSKGDEGKDVAELKEKDGQAENGSKDVLETLEKEGNVDRPMVKQLKVEEGANRSGEFTKTSHGLNVAGGEKEIQIQEGKRDAGSDKSVQRDSLRPNLERTNQGYVSDGQLGGTVGNNMHPQQMQAPGSLDRGQLQQQPTHQNVIPAQGHGYPQPGYNDRNPPQFPQQYPGSDDRQMPPGVPQQIPYGHPPHMSEPAMMSQRPPAPDRMFPQPLHQSSQERRFPDPSSYQMHVHGQAMPPSQMRPPGHNVRETFPHQGQMPVAQEPFWPPPHAGVSGPGPLPSSGGVPSHHGFPPKGFDQQAMAPQGQAQSHLPPPHVGGARTALGDPLARPFMGGPPPGPLDAPSRMMGGPPFISEDKVGKSATVNAIEAESHKRPGVYDGRQLEPHRPLPTEHAPYREPNIMKMNGVSNNVPVGGMHDSALPRGLPEDRFMPLPEERFKPFPEEGFKAAHDERFRPSSLDPGRHMVNRREFEEDLKQFPRPTHLVGEGPPEFDGYLSSSRPLDRMAQQPRGPNAMTSRPMSSYHSGAPFPPGIGGSEVHMDIGDRDRPIAFPEHLGRRHDGTFPHPDRLNLVPEFGRHRADGLPPLRSPGHFSRDIPDGLPSHLRRGMDGLGPLGPGSSSNIRGGEIVGSQNMPGFVRGGGFGGFRSHLDIGEPGGPGNLPSHLRIGDPGFNGRFSSASREGEIDSFEQSRKRKAGSMVRCLICKIDCETVEGLELHSQGREHQKMAMDMVLSIKKENAKKHRTSENSTPFEGANKSRKANFEKRANRQ